MRCGVYVRVSTDDQRDNGYSIDSQLRMIKEYCEKNDYLIVDVYNDAGHSGKDLMRPEMQRLLKDIKSKKKTTLDPDNDFKEYTVELLKKLDYEEDK
jgi:site-specific DNA recombinase